MVSIAASSFRYRFFAGRYGVPTEADAPRSFRLYAGALRFLRAAAEGNLEGLLPFGPIKHEMEMHCANPSGA